MVIETFDHTGDIGVRVSAPALGELFGEAARALTDAITEVSAVEPRESRQVQVAASELDLLLLDFLSEVLFRFDSESWLTRRAEVAIEHSGSPLSLRATLHGETLDPSRHGVKVLVKAVTYHELRVERIGDVWRATMVFDI